MGAAAVQQQLAAVGAAIEALSGERLKQLLLIRSSGRHRARLAAHLRQQAAKEAKFKQCVLVSRLLSLLAADGRTEPHVWFVSGTKSARNVQPLCTGAPESVPGCPALPGAAWTLFSVGIPQPLNAREVAAVIGRRAAQETEGKRITTQRRLMADAPALAALLERTAMIQREVEKALSDANSRVISVIGEINTLLGAA